MSITEQSAETCSELVKEKEDQCKSGMGHFFYGEVNPNHKECACCTGLGDEMQPDQMRDSPHFNIFKIDAKPDPEDLTEEEIAIQEDKF